MDTHYFAYGSNLCWARLADRVPVARSLGMAILPAHELRWHKRSVDGSGKCSIEPSDDPRARVYGALYSMSDGALLRLDRIEGVGQGYERRDVRVLSKGVPLRATTYVAATTHIDDALRPFAWYRELVVRGAEELGLPATYVAALRDVDVCPDPDPGRAELHLSILPCRGST